MQDSGSKTNLELESTADAVVSVVDEENGDTVNVIIQNDASALPEVEAEHTSAVDSSRKRALPPPLNYARDAFNRVPFYVWTAIFCSLSGFLFGFDTGSIGPITVMPQFSSTFPNISSILQGLIVSIILIPASLSSACAGPISDRFSRTRTMAVGALLFSIGSAVECAASSLAMLLVGRCIAGLGEGQFWGVTAVYVCEIAPTTARGRVANAVQLGNTFGVALGYFVCYGSARFHDDLAWRFPFGMQAIIAFVFAIGLPFLPHSPRWLTHVGREAEAMQAWRRLGVSPTEAEKEEEQIERGEARAQTERGGVRQELKKLWRKDIRMRTMLGVYLMAMQQMSGIDGVLHYAPVLFSKAGLSSTEASFLASGVSGLLLIACCFITQIYSDRWGRRPALIYGGSTISFSMFTIGILYASHATAHQAGRWLVIFLIYLFVFAFGIAWSSLMRVYVTEIQPMETRAAATSLAQTANWVVNWIIAFSTPLFLTHSTSGPYFLFGAATLITVCVCVAFQAESRGVSLEGIDALFRLNPPWKGIVSGFAKSVKGGFGANTRRRRGGTGEGAGTVGGTGSDIPIPLRPLGLSTA